MKDLEKILIDIQDKLVPHLDSYEQAVYHYLFRHTHLIGEKRVIFTTRSAEIGFGTADKSKKPSPKTKSDRIRSLERKGCLKIVERSNKGILVELILPHEIAGLNNPDYVEREIDIDRLDFYKDKRLLDSLLARENYRCFYTGRKISPENCYLDHVIPQASGGNNSYKNIVATSYDANSLKNDKPVDEFVRELYRDEIITLIELKELKQKIKMLQNGALLPDINEVENSIYG